MKPNSTTKELTESELKAKAYALKKVSGMQIGHCYEAIAKQYGYKTYAAMRAAAKEKNT